LRLTAASTLRTAATDLAGDLLSDALLTAAATAPADFCSLIRLQPPSGPVACLLILLHAMYAYSLHHAAAAAAAAAAASLLPHAPMSVYSSSLLFSSCWMLTVVNLGRGVTGPERPRSSTSSTRLMLDTSSSCKHEQQVYKANLKVITYWLLLLLLVSPCFDTWSNALPFFTLIRLCSLILQATQKVDNRALAAAASLPSA
jgi:hypothetical protein